MRAYCGGGDRYGLDLSYVQESSPLGTVIAGILLGLSEVLAQAYLEPRLGEFGHNIHVVFPYIVMILFLMVRPYGLLGQREVERL